MKCKKLIAMLLTTALTASASSSLVLADTYQDVEKAKFAEGITEFVTQYQKSLDNYDKSASGVHADLSLSLGETGRALAGMATSMDLSWLDNVGMSYDVGFADSMEAVVADILLNDSKVCSLETYIDMNTMQCYVRIPELHDAYLFADTSGGEELPEAYLDIMSDPTALLPEADVLEEILNRYSEILFDGFGESISGEDTISLNGVEMECTTLEGQMYEEDALTFATNLLTTLKNDQQIKEIIETWTVLDPSMEDFYEEFQSALEDSLVSLASESVTDDTSYISSKIWLNGDNKIVGRQLAMCQDTQTIPFITYMAPSTENASSLSLALTADGSSLELNGGGTITDGKLNGTYTLLYDGVAMAAIDVIDAEKAGTGSLKLYLLEGIGEENYASLGSFSILTDYAVSEDATLEQLALTVAASDAPIGTLSFSGGFTDPVEIPDFASLPNVLDASSEDDMVTFVTEMDWTPILENCVTAGMPQELADQLDLLIYDSIYGVEEEIVETEFNDF